MSHALAIAYFVIFAVMLGIRYTDGHRKPFYQGLSACGALVVFALAASVLL